MIAVVHGPRGCGKSTALRNWLARRGWMPPRGFRTFFYGSDGPLCISSWEKGAPLFAITEKPRTSSGFSPPSRPCPSGAWAPSFAPALDAFLDAVFFGGSPSSDLQIQPPIPPTLPAPSPPRSPWPFDSPAFWRVALSTLKMDSSQALVVDELGLLETLPGGLDSDALRHLLDVIHAVPRVILVIQDRALPFWLRALAGEMPSLPG